MGGSRTEILRGNGTKVPTSSSTTGTDSTRENQTRAIATQGYALYRAGKYPEAQKAFEEARKRSPLPFVYFEQLADTYERQGRWDDARKVYEAWVYPPPHSTTSVDARNLFAYALILLKTGQNAKAATVYNTAAQRMIAEEPRLYPVPLKRFDNPVYASARAIEAAVETGRGMTNLHFDQAQSQAQFRRAVRAYPNFAPANYYLAKELQYSGSPAEITERRAALHRLITSGTPDIQERGRALQKESEEAMPGYVTLKALGPHATAAQVRKFRSSPPAELRPFVIRPTEAAKGQAQ